MLRRTLLALVLVSTSGCGGETTSDAGGIDASATDAGTTDAGTTDAGNTDAGNTDAGNTDAGATDAGATDAGATDAGPSCLDEHAAGDRYPVGDHCNFCVCGADGAATCTARTCGGITSSCTYGGATHAYGERFAAADGCDECVCAASGLACTRRPACSGAEEGAILLETMTEACGDDPTFTGDAVLAGLPVRDLTTAFPYERGRATYPETLPDTNLRLRIVYEGGFVVCRLPSPTQPAIDMEVVVEWITEDGAFDEAMHTYLRRNDFGFVDAWTTVGSAPVGGLDGTYTPACLDPNGFSFAAQVNADGTAEGSISKVCETDIGLDVGRFAYAP
ncbi:MAG: hypothetical protein H6719_15565 [Sandaracinaceae bacterium]|nr:hypothetical protein [Sandaracinaceae bacterium]